MEDLIHEFLLSQLPEEPEMTSALMIYTLNKDREKAKVGRPLSSEHHSCLCHGVPQQSIDLDLSLPVVCCVNILAFSSTKFCPLALITLLIKFGGLIGNEQVDALLRVEDVCLGGRCSETVCCCLQVGMDILCKYLDNLINNPGEEKFRKIRLANKAFQVRYLLTVHDCGPPAPRGRTGEESLQNRTV